MYARGLFIATCARRFASVFGAHHCASKSNATYYEQNRRMPVQAPYCALSADCLSPSSPAVQSRPFAHIHRQCYSCCISGSTMANTQTAGKIMLVLFPACHGEGRVIAFMGQHQVLCHFLPWSTSGSVRFTGCNHLCTFQY